MQKSVNHDSGVYRALGVPAYQRAALYAYTARALSAGRYSLPSLTRIV
ncbi:MAG: hypothetical protein ACXVI9_11305 [Mucilaginibacter sp.]